jgi:hypothetical protein
VRADCAVASWLFPLLWDWHFNPLRSPPVYIGHCGQTVAGGPRLYRITAILYFPLLSLGEQKKELGRDQNVLLRVSTTVIPTPPFRNSFHRYRGCISSREREIAPDTCGDFLIGSQGVRRQGFIDRGRGRVRKGTTPSGNDASVLPDAARHCLGGFLWQSDPRTLIHA